MRARAAYLLRLLGGAGAHRAAQAHFIALRQRFGRGQRCGRPVQHIEADKIEMNLIGLQTHALEALEHRLARLAGAFVGMRPGKEGQALADPTSLVADHELERVGTPASAHIADPHAVGARLGEGQ